MRAIMTLVHRWAGLTIAAFLFLTGITGAIISWDHALDDFLNPHLMEVSSRGPFQSPFALASQIEARHPEIFVRNIPLHAEEGESMSFFVSPRVDASSGKLFDVNYNQIFVDPVTGAEIGKRNVGAAWPINRENLVSFLYVLHFTLHIPQMWGTDRWGVWLLGIIALVWIVDCFVSFYLTLPVRKAKRNNRAEQVQRQIARGWWKRWQPAWKIKISGSAYRINFDIHRAFGLWFWILLFILAVSSASLNLYREVAQPLVKMFSSFTPTPFDLRKPTPPNEPIFPAISHEQILALAKAEAAKRGWQEPAGRIFYAHRYGVFGVGFYKPGDDHGAAGVGPPYLYFDGKDGSYLGARIPWSGTAGDIFLQVQFPLHSGRILGMPGRILISFMGLAVATLSVTGVVIWYRKRRARILAASRQKSNQAGRALAPAE